MLQTCRGCLKISMGRPDFFLPGAANSGFRVKIKKYSFSDFSRNDSFFYGSGIPENILFLKRIPKFG